MSYTPGFYSGNGSSTTFTVPFPFISRAHVRVSVAGVDRSFTWISNSQISVAPAPAAGARVVVYRETPQTPLVDFQSGAGVQESDLDTATLQAIYLMQETEYAARDKTLRVADNDDPVVVNTLPARANRLNRALIFDTDGQPTAGPTAAEITAAQGHATAAANSATAAANSATAAQTAANKIPNPVVPADNGKAVRVRTDGSGQYELFTAAGTGDVVGPASAIDRSIALFSGAGGKLLKTGPALGTSGWVLVSQGSAADPVFGQVPTAGIADQAVTLAKVSRTGGAAGQILYHNGASGDPFWGAPPAAGEANTGVNVGSGSGSIFKDKNGLNLRFRSLSVVKSGTRPSPVNGGVVVMADFSVSVVTGADDVTVTLTPSWQEVDSPPQSGGGS